MLHHVYTELKDTTNIMHLVLSHFLTLPNHEDFSWLGILQHLIATRAQTHLQLVEILPLSLQEIIREGDIRKNELSLQIIFYFYLRIPESQLAKHRPVRFSLSSTEVRVPRASLDVR